jgi:general stress protein 26
MASTLEWSEVAEHLTGFAHVATVRPDGVPHVSKVAPALEGDVLWIATRASSRKARNVAAGSRVAVMFEPQAEVYVDADAELVDDAATKQRIWMSGLFPFPLDSFFGSVDNPDFVLVRLRPRSAIVMRHGVDGIGRDTWERTSSD